VGTELVPFSRKRLIIDGLQKDVMDKPPMSGNSLISGLFESTPTAEFSNAGQHCTCTTTQRRKVMKKAVPFFINYESRWLLPAGKIGRLDAKH